MIMDNTEQTGEQNIVNIDSSSTSTDSSNGLPEVTPAPRQSLPKVYLEANPTYFFL